MIASVDIGSVLRGAAAGMVVALPTFAVGAVAVGDEPPLWAVLGYLALMALSFLAAGFVAGLRRTDTPISHGGLAAAVVFVAMQVVLRLATGAGAAWLVVLVLAVLAATVGVGGGLLAEARHRLRRRRTALR